MTEESKKVTKLQVTQPVVCNNESVKYVDSFGKQVDMTYYQLIKPELDREELPKSIARALALAPQHAQEAIALLSFLCVLSAVLTDWVKIKHGKRKYPLVLMVIMMGDAAIGKGFMPSVAKLIEAYHNRCLEESVNERQLAKQQGKDPLPLRRPFILSSDITGRAIKDLLVANKGRGLLLSPEIDSLSTSNNSTFGNFTVILRLDFDGEKYTFSRHMDDVYEEIKELAFAVLLTGTPAQFQPLIKNSESGLQSRIVVYNVFKEQDEQVDASVFDEDEDDECSLSVDEQFLEWGERLLEVIDALDKYVDSIQFKFTKEQSRKMTELLKILLKRAQDIGFTEMEAVAKRMPINLKRMMAIVAFLRCYDDIITAPKGVEITREDMVNHPLLTLLDEVDGKARLKLTINDFDFQWVSDLAKPLFLHSEYAAKYLPKGEARRYSHVTSPTKQLILSLPNIFKCEEAVKKGEDMGIPANTVRVSLRRLVESEDLVQVSRGKYRKKGNIKEDKANVIM